MSSHFRRLAVVVMLTASASDALADVAPCLVGWGRRNPRNLSAPPAPEETTLDFEIIRDPNCTQAELRIPRSILIASNGGGSTRTALAGLALSAAVVTGGLWCVCFRGDKVPRKKLLGAVALVLLLVGSVVFVSLAEANMPPPSGLSRFALPVELAEIDVQVRIVEQGTTIQLVAPPELADKITAR